MAMVTWLLSRVKEDASARIETNELYDAFKLETIESGVKDVPLQRAFSTFILCLYPNSKRILKTTKNRQQTFYEGICMNNDIKDLEKRDKWKDITVFFPKSDSFCVTDEQESFIKCQITSNFTSNGNPLNKELVFSEDGSWSVKVSGKVVCLESLALLQTYECNKNSVEAVISAAMKMNLCEGLIASKQAQCTKYNTLELLQINNTESRRIFRSVLCNRVVPYNSVSNVCIKCQKMTINAKGAQNDNEAEQAKEAISSTSTDNSLSFLENQDMIEFLNQQLLNAKKHPSGRRWSKTVVHACLKWYCRSPYSYEEFRAGGHLVLPSRSCLLMYKNRVKQEVGFDVDNFKWMFEEAKRKEIPEEGLRGGIIFDEMAIQTDIQIAKNGDLIELCGFVDVGPEGNDCNSLRKGKREQLLGTHILQFLFLGLTGFRFPFAHFVTEGIQAPQLYTLFWEAVDKLQTFGFSVLYTCMDGAQSNRTFMKINIGENNSDFFTMSPCSFSPMFFIMDPCHVYKKIRNNIMKSGIGPQCTRILTLPSGKTIHWQMFIDTYKWDKQNALQLHRHLTNEHFFPSNSSKMRNHLAEHVLDSEMLNVVMQYKSYLGEKGSVLDGVLELLQRTSKLIEIFHDKRPVTSTDNEILLTLIEIAEWFDEWKCCGISSKSKTQTTIMSIQCHEDIQSCIKGFCQLCKFIVENSEGVHVTPAFINSDVIENTFNQQRSTYHGANTNPNCYQYRSALNNIILNEKAVSTKANAGKNKDAALPYDCETHTKRNKCNQKSKEN